MYLSVLSSHGKEGGGGGGDGGEGGVCPCHYRNMAGAEYDCQ